MHKQCVTVSNIVSRFQTLLCFFLSLYFLPFFIRSFVLFSLFHIHEDIKCISWCISWHFLWTINYPVSQSVCLPVDTWHGRSFGRSICLSTNHQSPCQYADDVCTFALWGAKCVQHRKSYVCLFEKKNKNKMDIFACANYRQLELR